MVVGRAGRERGDDGGRVAVGVPDGGRDRRVGPGDRAGQIAPGTSSPSRFRRFDLGPRTLALNEAGQVAFAGQGTGARIDSSRDGARNFNDRGELPMTLRFSDGSQAVVVVTVPEPTALALAAALGGLLVRRRYA